MKLQLKRRFFGETYTIGTLFIDGVRFCDTLEDANHDKNHNGQFDNGETKVKHHTAIPFGTYNIIVNRSPRYWRNPALLFSPTSLPERPLATPYSIHPLADTICHILPTR